VSIDTSEVKHLAADLYAAPAKAEAGAIGAVHETVSDTERDAKAFAPVLTGELKERIEGRALGLLGEVVSGAPYSEYVEDGTSDTAPQPFMGPALELNAPGLEGQLGDIGEDIF
jgi:HK97 gp10 family phage protein